MLGNLHGICDMQIHKLICTWIATQINLYVEIYYGYVHQIQQERLTGLSILGLV